MLAAIKFQLSTPTICWILSAYEVYFNNSHSDSFTAALWTAAIVLSIPNETCKVLMKFESVWRHFFPFTPFRLCPCVDILTGSQTSNDCVIISNQLNFVKLNWIISSPANAIGRVNSAQPAPKQTSPNLFVKFSSRKSRFGVLTDASAQKTAGQKRTIGKLANVVKKPENNSSATTLMFFSLLYDFQFHLEYLAQHVSKYSSRSD